MPVLVTAGLHADEAGGQPKLGQLLPVIDAILETDRTALVKQRHTAKRIFERLRDEHDNTYPRSSGEGEATTEIVDPDFGEIATT